MVEFLDTKGVISKLHDLILQTDDTLILVSPYISKVPENIIIRLQDALSRNVRVTLLCRELKNIHEKEIERLRALEGLELLQNPDLHAKAYFNEQEAIVTSFNLSGYSEQSNFEFGIYFRKEEHGETFKKLANQTRLIINNSEYVDLVSLNSLGEQVSPGFCIRCNCKISLNPAKPLCESCFRDWRRYGHPGRFCHACGTASETALHTPLCKNC